MRSSLSVWPSNRGEKGYHQFVITNINDVDLVPSQELWIFFDSLQYDYYIGESDILYAGDLD